MSISTQNVNSSFFRGMYKEVWRKLINPGLTKAEADFIIEIAGLKPNEKVLDLMCGYGRHALELAKNGIHVQAIDNEPSYIKELSEEASKLGLPVDARSMDVMKADLTTSFKTAICMGNSFAFFNKEEALILLQKVSGALEDGGVLIIGSWMLAEIALKHFKEKEWMQVDEYKYLLSHIYHPIPARIESEHTIIRDDGAMEVMDGVDYIFSISELDQMFRHAGLTTKALYSTPRKKKFTLGDPAIYIVAEKRS